MTYFDYIQNAIPKITELLKGELGDYLKVINIKKGDYLLKPGQICDSYYFVEEGILRSFYLKEEKEIISTFTFPNDIVTIFKSTVRHEPSNEYIQAITDCSVLQIKVSVYEQLKSKNPDLQEIENIFFVAYTLWLEERLFSLQFHSAQERYKFLCDNYKIYINNIPLTYIASYLGITIETLSRIRAAQ